MLEAALEPAGFAVDHVASIASAEAALAAGHHDIAVLDLRLPDGNGLDLLKRCRANGVAIPILILSGRDSPAERVRGLEEGGDDYMGKPFHLDELVARLRVLLRRPNQALGIHLIIGNVDFDTVALKVTVANLPLSLSRRELRLLELFMRRAGRVLTKDVIEHALYSFDDEIESNAVEVLMHRLRRKLADAGANSGIQTLRGIGYVMDDAR
ncbi:response regulator transcription factor [Ancylobacter sonchi]